MTEIMAFRQTKWRCDTQNGVFTYEMALRHTKWRCDIQNGVVYPFYVYERDYG
jgi:hypothetical protein